MSRWTAESADDYRDEVEHRVLTRTIFVTCLACGRKHRVERDNPPPYRCTSCIRPLARRKDSAA